MSSTRSSNESRWLMILVKWKSSADSEAAVSPRLARGEQCIRIGPRQVEAALEQLRDDPALRLVKLVVAVRRLNQQRRQGNLQRFLPPTNLLPPIRPIAADPRPDTVDHRLA